MKNDEFAKTRRYFLMQSQVVTKSEKMYFWRLVQSGVNLALS